MVDCVLFDLDDTIFDHQYSRRLALGGLKERYLAGAGIDLLALEAIHEKHLQVTHLLLLDGVISPAVARRERLRLLFSDLNVRMTDDDLAEADGLYHRIYDEFRRAVPGSVELIRLLKATCKMGVVTNGLLAQQTVKTRLCGVHDLIDCMVVSEEVGVKKPHRRIFDIALERLGAAPEEAVVIGDSWRFDVMGARAAGLRAIWFNRYSEKCPEPGTVVEVTSLEPPESILKIL